MGNCSDATLDRDRAFDINSINELLTQGKAILNEAISISEKMETSISKISGVYNTIDAEYKVSALGTDIYRLSGTLKKACYQETIDSMDKILSKLISDIPTYDTSLSQSVDGIEEVLNSVKGRVSDLKSLLETGDVDLSYEEFSSRLGELKAGWDETTQDLAETLAEIEADMLGVSVTAVMYSSDPVNLSTGNFVYDHEDMKVNGEIPLSFHRYYNSKARGKGSLGRCFMHNYDSHLEENAEKGKITITMEDGQKKTFRMVENGTYISLHSATETLTKEGENYALTELTGGKRLYNASGQMTHQENRNGRGITFSHDEAGRLKKAETDNKTYLEYGYDEEGKLVSVTDHTGRKVELTYEKGRLARVKNPAGSVYAYSYAKNGRLEETVNPRGYTAVKNTYDDKRRITRQEFPDGGHMEYAYDDSKRHVILTERNGSRITYVHDSKYRNTDIIYEDGTKEHFAYNGKNQRVLYVDRNGNTTRMAYDNRGNLTQVINALGEKASITYDALNKPINFKINGREKQKNSFDGKGNLSETVDALSRKTVFSYNSAGLPETVTQPDGSVIRMKYDERGNITGITDAGGATTGYAYDELNRVVLITDPNGHQMSLTYDEADNIRTLTNAEGNVRTYEYNESNKVTGITDFDGSTVRRRYNVLNKPEEVTDQMGRTTRLSYDAMWNLACVAMPDGAETHYHYDTNNRLAQVEDAMGNMVRYTYDGNGNRLSVEDRNGNTTRFSYDAAGRLTHAKGPEGAEMTYTYDEEGHVIEAEDALGNRVFMEYDEAGQLIKEKNSMGNSRVYTYTPLGKTESVMDEAGRTTRYAYLPGGRLSEVLHSDGTKESYTYDANGNIKTHTDRTGFVVSYGYDCLDRITCISGSRGEKKEYAYDAVGNVTAMTDAYGNVTRYEYSLTGKLIKVTDALGNETEYTYDLCDRLIEIRQYGEEINVTDEELLHAEKQNRDNSSCHVTCYRRNALGQVESITDALGNTEHYSYDAKEQLIEKLDKEGYLTKYGYTAQGDVNRIAYADGREVKLSYNPLRQLVEMEDWLGITKIENDAMGRALKVQYPDGKEVSYTYGKSGERTGITYPDGRKVSYEYDSLLRLSGLNDGSGVINYAYDETGRLARKTFPNGMETSYAYNEEGFLSELVHRDSEGILDRYAYSYDLTGNKTTIEKQRRGLSEESGSYAYGYDALGRLATVARNGENLRTYEYDAFGNRSLLREGNKETVYFYNAMNQLISRADAMNEETYTYDKRGNLSLIMENGALKNRYVYGSLNRLEQAVNGRGDSALYAYNGLGHRTGRETNRGREDYLIDLTRPYHNMLMMTDAEKSQTFYWDGNVSAMSERRTRGTAEINAPDGATDRIASGAYEITPIFHYYLQDDLGSPLRVSGYDAGTEGKEGGYLTYGYDEFGNDLCDSLYNDMEDAGIPNPYSRQGEEQPFGYTGYRRDDISGTYFAQAREYQPQNGRFTAEDVIKGNGAFPDTLNQYGYCWGNPMILVDNNGKSVVLAVIGLVVVGIVGVTSYIVSEYPDKYIEKYDEQGQELLNRYVYGDGTSYIIDNDDSWSEYIKENEYLTVCTGRYLVPIGKNLKEGESIDVDMQIPMIIQDDNYKTGYMLIHGANEDVGGYQIQGTVAKEMDGTTIYNMKYTFNDKMDPELKYKDDRRAVCGLKFLQLFHHDITMKDYELHVSWTDTTTISPDGTGDGWLVDMELVNFSNRIQELKLLTLHYKSNRRDRGKKQSAKLTLEVYTQMQNYMREHPEYYGCVVE
ncbi:MAG: RHS repeat protein [Lachnospiraceae bacterium]|nr:RHS repeat protein [Lachnospiraceae bacterium]